jgi:hypothetical protein
VWDGRAWTRRSLPDDPRLKPFYGEYEAPVTSLVLDSGELAVLRSAANSIDIVVVPANGGKPETSPPIPVRTDWVRGTFVGTSAADLHLCLGHGAIYARRAPASWAAVEAPAGEIASCARTAGGELWAVHGSSPAALSRRTPSEWERVELPAEDEPVSVAAADDRVWVVAGGMSANSKGASLWSTEPVREPVVVTDTDLPGELYVGISGLDATGPDVPSVSSAPPGPGSSACSSLLVYLGPAPRPELPSLLARSDATSKLEIFEASGQAAGKLRVTGARSEMSLVPSAARTRVLYAPVTSYAAGKRAVDALRAAGASPTPSLICAIPRAPRKLGP